MNFLVNPIYSAYCPSSIISEQSAIPKAGTVEGNLTETLDLQWTQVCVWESGRQRRGEEAVGLNTKME